jgi:hypothetical protein
MENEKTLIDIFAVKGAYPYQFVRLPFCDGEYVYATDLHNAVRIEQALCDGEYENQTEKVDIKQQGFSYLLLLGNIQFALDEWERINENESNGAKDSESKSANGSGSKGAEGSGSKRSGKRRFATDWAAHFHLIEGDYCVSLHSLGLLAQAMKLFGKDRVFMGDTNTILLHFSVAEGVDVFLEKIAPLEGRMNEIHVERNVARANSGIAMSLVRPPELEV